MGTHTHRVLGVLGCFYGAFTLLRGVCSVPKAVRGTLPEPRVPNVATNRKSSLFFREFYSLLGVCLVQSEPKSKSVTSTLLQTAPRIPSVFDPEFIDVWGDLICKSDLLILPRDQSCMDTRGQLFITKEWHFYMDKKKNMYLHFSFLHLE